MLFLAYPSHAQALFRLQNVNGGGGVTMTPLCSQNTANFYTSANCASTTAAAAAAGGRVVVFIGGSHLCTDATFGVTSITLGSLTFALDTGTASQSGLCTWSAQVGTTVASGSTFTLTASASGGNANWNFWVYYLSQSKTSGAVEQGNSLTQSFGTAVSIPAAGAVTSTDACVAILQGSGTEMQNWSSGWTTLLINQTTVTSPLGFAWILASTGTPTATMTLTTSDNKPSAISCYKTI